MHTKHTQQSLLNLMLPVLASHTQKPLNYKQLATLLEISDLTLKHTLLKLLEQETERGVLEEIGKGKYRL